jgi:hypothetical protein
MYVTQTSPENLRFVVSFNAPAITGAVQIIGYLKTGTVSGPAAGLRIYGGAGYSSHMDIEGTAGVLAGDVDAKLTTHTNRTDNPHGVTAAQVGAVSTDDARYLAALTNYSATPFDAAVTITNTSPLSVTSYFGHAYSRTFTSTGTITHVFLGNAATSGNEIFMETTATGLPARVWPAGYVFGYAGSISSNAPSPSPWAQMSVQKTPMGSIVWCVTGQVWQAGTP